MFNYTCLNPIANVGLDLLTDDYKKVDDLADAQAVLVRSAAMHDLELPEGLESVAIAGAGVQYTRCQCKRCKGACICGYAARSQRRCRRHQLVCI